MNFVIVAACISCSQANSSSNDLHSPPLLTVEKSPRPAPELSDTFVHEVPSETAGRHYQLWVSLPADYVQGEKKYPVVFVTDAGYSFPLVRSIRNLLGQRGRNIEDFILVGLPPERGMSSKDSRGRDYTPSTPVTSSPVEHAGARYGEAQAYRNYLEHQVFPLVASEYDSDMCRTVFVGHSYGGLFGSYVMLTKPHMFSTYILGSPSLWFDNHAILRIEESYAKSSRELPVKVMMYAGEFETPGDGPRYFTSVDLVGDMRSFEHRLESRNYEGLTVDSTVIPGEDHLTIFPTLVSRGLLWALPGHGTYTSG